MIHDVDISKATKLQSSIEAIMASYGPKVARAFVAAIEAQSRKLDRKALVKALAERDINAAVRAMNLDPQAMTKLLSVLHDAYTEAGMATAEQASVTRGASTFNAFGPRSVQTVQAIGNRMLGNMTAEASNAVTGMVARQVAAGRPPTAIANDIARIVGLTEQQAVAVGNYRKALESLKSDALTRALRDRRYDTALRLARKKGEALPRARVERMVARYAARLLKSRGEAIARTEAARMANQGAHEAILQAMEQGKVPSNRLRRFWIIASDELTCPICKPIPKLNSNGVGMSEPFVTTTGTAMMPPIHPHCRCSIAFRLPML